MRRIAGPGALRAALIFLSFLFLGTGIAQAMMPPWVYEEARAEAPYHVQIAIEAVKAPAKTPGNCEVSGKVVRIFRDTAGTLSDDQHVTFPIACIRSDSEVYPGPAIWTSIKDLVDASYIEVYLVDGDNGLEPAKWQSRIIEEPSSEPKLPVKEEE